MSISADKVFQKHMTTDQRHQANLRAKEMQGNAMTSM